MSEYSTRLCGDEWQIWANQLLNLRYGPGEYQRVPDNQKGDAGIEGFVAANGHVYQVYGPEEPLSTGQRYEKHRKKMTRDIKKLIDKGDIISGIIGNMKIRRWILLVPYFDSKDIVIHASKKTEEVIEADLPYIEGSEFRIIIQSEDDFSIERVKLLEANLSGVLVVADTISPSAVIEWADKNDNLVKTIDDKVARMKTMKDIERRRKFRDEIIKRYLEGQNVLEKLRDYPAAYEGIRRAKSERERYLTTEVLLAAGAPPKILHDALENIQNVVRTEVRGVSGHTIDAVAWEAIADWLIRCPLDFPEECSNGLSDNS